MGNEQASMNEELHQKIYNDTENKFKMNDTNKNTKYEFSICSFNIWCPYWNDSNGVEANYPDRWKKRNNDILKLISSPILSHNNNDEEKKDENNDDLSDIGINADIYCIQEFWCDNKEFINLYNNYLKDRNYKIIYLTRSASRKPDGVAILVNVSVFKIIKKYDLEYSSSNRVAIMLVLQHIESGMNIAVGNTHFTFPNGYNGSSRKAQCKQFVELLEKYKGKRVGMSVLCGDYNCDINQAEAVLCLNAGYKSSFHVCNVGELNGDGGVKGGGIKCVSHLTHKGTEVFVDHVFYKGNEDVNDEDKFGFRVKESYLYPKGVGIDKWPSKKEFDLSDHRPLVTTFQIQKM